MKLYGIKNCDTVKKAIKHLETLKLDYEFIDLKVIELELSHIKLWMSKAPGVLINKRSTTYRLNKLEIESIMGNSEKLIQFIQINPTIVKRPVLEIKKDKIIIGYKKEIYNLLS